MLSEITPIILTSNEAVNIARVLDRLFWAKDIVVVDSGSRDATRDIIASYPNARVFERTFDSHADQWNFALEQTEIRSEWVLALDADHVMTEDLMAEISSLSPGADISGFRVAFTYCVLGRPLRASLYPPLVSIFRRESAYYVQQGHTQRLVVEGAVVALEAHMLHDDRKPFGRWLRSQERYMRLEADLIKDSSWSELSWPNRLRMFILPGPPLALLWCLFVKRTILDGIPGIYYGVQRMVAESILSFHLIARLPR
jgi:hypothetical protein